MDQSVTLNFQPQIMSDYRLSFPKIKWCQCHRKLKLLQREGMKGHEEPASLVGNQAYFLLPPLSPLKLCNYPHPYRTFSLKCGSKLCCYTEDLASSNYLQCNFRKIRRQQSQGYLLQMIFSAITHNIKQ